MLNKHDETSLMSPPAWEYSEHGLPLHWTSSLSPGGTQTFCSPIDAMVSLFHSCPTIVSFLSKAEFDRTGSLLTRTSLSVTSGVIHDYLSPSDSDQQDIPSWPFLIIGHNGWPAVQTPMGLQSQARGTYRCGKKKEIDWGWIARKLGSESLHF